MQEALRAGLVFLLLLASTALGMFVKGRLSERHHNHETIELVGLAITMLVTFAALVMSLLIYSVKGAFDEANTDMAAPAALSISSAVFVMLDMDAPFSGAMVIPSQPMRNAYSDIPRPYTPPPVP